MATSRIKAADSAPTVPQAPQFVIPDDWNDVEEFGGHNLTDKADLIGVPFLILGAMFEHNDNRDYDVCYVYAVDTNKTEFEFSDTSTTGVMQQLKDELEKTGLVPADGLVDAGFIPFRRLLRQGLRVSEFDAQVLTDKGLKMRRAKTYYINAKSVRPDVQPPTATTLAADAAVMHGKASASTKPRVASANVS